jgi:alanyl-tRNA synthetase
VAPLAAEMGFAYPELTKAKSVVEKVLLHEEEQFAQTLDQGMKLLEQTLTGLKTQTIPGEVVFRLYDTYGFPPDLTADIARERNLSLDYAGFESSMEKQRQQSQAASQFAPIAEGDLTLSGETEFVGYECLTGSATVIGLVHNGKMIESLAVDMEGAVILDRTPFYAESGGQVGDKGELFFENGLFVVHDTQKRGAVFLHYGKLQSGELKTGIKVSAEVAASRHEVMLNHTATHLLHAALRRILGEHVTQKGSLVAADRLRFDFSHFTALKPEQIKEVERLVNQQIRANLDCHIDFKSMDEAKKSGAMALFDEKYGDEVRVLSIGEFSMELCGGTHLSHTGQIGLFKIIQETGIAAGVRRIEAITGEKALDWIDQQSQEIDSIASLLKTPKEEVVSKLQQLLAQTRGQEKTLSQLKQQIMRAQLDALMAKAVTVENTPILAEKIADADLEDLRYLVDLCKQRWEKGVILLAAIVNGKIQLVAGVSKNSVNQYKAGELVSFAAQELGGKGGGRADSAQGGGDRLEKLDEVLAMTKEWAKQKK